MVNHSRFTFKASDLRSAVSPPLPFRGSFRTSPFRYRRPFDSTETNDFATSRSRQRARALVRDRRRAIYERVSPRYVPHVEWRAVYVRGIHAPISLSPCRISRSHWRERMELGEPALAGALPRDEHNAAQLSLSLSLCLSTTSRVTSMHTLRTRAFRRNGGIALKRASSRT